MIVADKIKLYQRDDIIMIIINLKFQNTNVIHTGE